MIENHKEWYNHIKNLPIDQQLVYTISTFDWQVKNGGFDRYFFNPYGMFAFITIQNLDTIGLSIVQDLLSAALAIVNYDNLDEEEFRKRVFYRRIEKIVNFDEVLIIKLEELDNIYYSLSEDVITQYLLKYLNNEGN